MPEDRLFLDTELMVVRWQRGDRTAFDGIVALWEQSLFYYLRRLAPSEADAWELMQETWLKVLKHLKSLRDPRSFPAFLYRTARNAAITRFRSGDFYQIERTEEICDSAQADPVTRFDDAEQVHRALDRLPLLQREVLTLFFLRELSLEEMSVLLGIPVGTVKSRLHYAKQAIRRILSEGDHHDRTNRGISSASAERPGSLPRASGGV